MNDETRLWGMRVSTYCMLLHLSPLAGFLNVLLGIAVPVFLWLVHRDASGEVDAHGRRVLNWLISLAVYWVGCLLGFWLLMGVFMGVLPMPDSFDFDVPEDGLEALWPFALLMGGVAVILMGLFVIFAIVGAIKANKGVRWRYPLAIRFLREEGRGT